MLEVEFLDDPWDEFKKKKRPRKGTPNYQKAKLEISLIKGQIICAVLLLTTACAFILFYLITFIRARRENRQTSVHAASLPIQAPSSWTTGIAPPPYDSITFDTQYESSAPLDQCKHGYQCSHCRQVVPIHH
ncbi:unnamed protein product [Rotaria sp. Silwood2]|nr:unnamed protein product [Rotaria sp. Silwood2]CAF4386655.1 unnamed protein product [Rotaria sp. Silwood2]CAF4712044.1 unnamed protein product [Rotaria sp. Silwood2]CAF4758857.1 unnamed protein product [Rotaria sp. Silwood2]